MYSSTVNQSILLKNTKIMCRKEKFYDQILQAIFFHMSIIFYDLIDFQNSLDKIYLVALKRAVFFICLHT